MRTAKEILYDKARAYNDGFLSGQPKWIIEAMEDYATEVNKELVEACEAAIIEICNHEDGHKRQFQIVYEKLQSAINKKRFVQHKQTA